MTTPRFDRFRLMTKRLTPYMMPIFMFTAPLIQTGCSTSASNGDSDVAEDLDSSGTGESELNQELNSADSLDVGGADTSAIAAEELSLDGDLAAPSGSGTDDIAVTSDADTALTQQLAKEDLSDTGGFDLDAAESRPAEAQAPEPLVSAAPAIDMSPVAEPSASEVGAPIPMQTSGDQVTITNLKYASRKGGGTIVIETSAPATYHTREVSSQNQVVVEIDNAILPTKLKRPFVMKDFNQSISSMNAYQEPGSTTARVVIQFKTPQAASVQQTGNVLTIAANGGVGDEFVDGSGNSAQASSSGNSLGDATGDGSGAENYDDGAVAASGGGRGDASDRRILPSSATDPTGFDNTRFYGRPISIEVRDTSVRDVINLIAEQSGANIVLAGEVEGNISLKLRQVPWDQALLIVMKTRGLGYVRQGSILRVAPYENLQKEVDAARKVAEAQKAAEPLRVKVIPVGYAKVEGLDKQILPFLTKERGRVVTDIRTNSVIVTDTVDVLARISNLVKAIDTPPLQVLIEGKVVEAREVFKREAGINWGWTGQDVDLGGNRFLGNNFKVSPGALNRGSGALGEITLGTLDIFGDLSAQLRLYELENTVHVISSPRVVVLNNEAANIVQSTNIPVATINQSAGVAITSTTYQPIEMKLEVIPQVTSESDIILNVAIKREFAGASGNPPDINKREAKTKVLVRNGQTAVIGGVYQADSAESEGGVPWLRKLPVLGWLFKQKAVDNNKSEMLVFITPRILNAETAIQKENNL